MENTIVSKPLFGSSFYYDSKWRFVGHFYGWDVWFNERIEKLSAQNGPFHHCWAPLKSTSICAFYQGKRLDLISFAKKYHAKKPGLLDAFLKAKYLIDDPSVSPNE